MLFLSIFYCKVVESYGKFFQVTMLHYMRLMN